MSESSHKVKTLKKAQEWYGESVESDLPLTINSNTCKSCGRLHYTTWNNAGWLLRKFN